MDFVNDKSVLQAAETIERTGYGQYQVRALLLGAGAVYMAEGGFDVDATGCALEKYGADPMSAWAQAVKVLMDQHKAVSVLLGCLLGDVVGRRSLLVWSLGIAAVSSWACVLVPNYYVATVANVFAAYCCRVPFVAGLAITSECTQREWRILHRALGIDHLNVTGLIFGVLTALHRNPATCSGGSLTCMFPLAIFSLIYWALSSLLLPESPVFLAGSGQYQRAREELETMQRVNGAVEGSGHIAVSVDGGAGRIWSLRERLEALVTMDRGRAFLFMVFAIMVAKQGVVDLKDHLMDPQNFYSTDNLGDWSDAVQNVIRIVGECVAFANATYFTRPVALGNAFLINASSLFLLMTFSQLRDAGIGGVFVDLVAQIAGAWQAYSNRVVLTVGYQIAVEFWPTMAAVTAGSIIISSGYTSIWKAVWHSIKSPFPTAWWPWLDIIHYTLVGLLAWTMRAFQRPGEGPQSAIKGQRGKAAKYGTFQHLADA